MAREENWRHRAACKDEDPELFFPVGHGGRGRAVGEANRKQAQAAKAVCHRCPVIEQCRRWATETVQEHGIWGGTTPDDRRDARRRARRQRYGVTSAELAGVTS